MNHANKEKWLSFPYLQSTAKVCSVKGPESPFALLLAYRLTCSCTGLTKATTLVCSSAISKWQLCFSLSWFLPCEYVCMYVCEGEERERNHCIIRAELSKVNYSLYLNQSWDCVLTTLCWTKKFLCWRVGLALTCQHWEHEISPIYIILKTKLIRMEKEVCFLNNWVALPVLGLLLIIYFENRLDFLFNCHRQL